MKIVTVVGARPQFVKAAVLRKKFTDADIEETLIHTGQHYDHAMSDVFFAELDIRAADHKLDLSYRSHAGMTGEIMMGVEKVLIDEAPDWCLVYGDTNSTLAAALTAAKLHIPICHVEAGLRSFNRKMPEEINRILTDQVSDLLFCPTKAAVEHLKKENIDSGVFHVGDIMYDAVKLFGKSMSFDSLCQECSLDSNKPIAVVTLHRAETLGDKIQFETMIEYIKSFSQDYQLVFAVHPHTQKKIDEYGIKLDGFVVLRPQPYSTMQALLSHAELVFTDSGGMQKEAYFYNTRCVTMRKETEWVETIDAGWNRLWVNSDYACSPTEISDYGTGTSAEKMIEHLVNHS